MGNGLIGVTHKCRSTVSRKNIVTANVNKIEFDVPMGVFGHAGSISEVRFIIFCLKAEIFTR